MRRQSSLQQYTLTTVRGILHPERYHGTRRARGPFFEGWYYKLVDASEQQRWAVIPGIFLGQDRANREAFVQVLDGTTGRASYHAYRVSEFAAARDAFDVRVGASRFGADGLTLRIDSPERPIEGELRFRGGVPWPVSWRSPGIMGPYAWVPFMECYHGVPSLDHEIEGSLRIAGESIDFSGGRGYLEKDWGQAFPSAYVWMQSNHFETRGTSLSASIAIIPWLRSSFRGFIIGLWHEGVLHRFATYTGALTESLSIDDESVNWSVRDRRLRLEMVAARAAAGLLASPARTQMHKRVDETLSARVAVRLSRLGRGGSVLFEDRGRCAGLEVHGDLDRLLRG